MARRLRAVGSWCVRVWESDPGAVTGIGLAGVLIGLVAVAVVSQT